MAALDPFIVPPTRLTSRVRHRVEASPPSRIDGWWFMIGFLTSRDLLLLVIHLISPISVSY